MTNYNQEVIIGCGIMLLCSCCATSAYANLPCVRFSEQETNELTDELLDEISGLAASHNNPDYFWAHVDSDGPAALYLIDRQGTIVHTFNIKEMVNTDWEDIAVAPCEAGSTKNCIYIADLGDNFNCRVDKKILLVLEPDLSKNTFSAGGVTEIELYKTQPVSFPEVTATEDSYINPDSESLMVDPLTSEMFVLSKQSNGGYQTLYHVPRDEFGASTILEPLGEYEFTSALGNLKKVYNAVTGADFSPDGTNFVIRTYAKIYQYDLLWFGDMATAFANPLEAFSTTEIQGESIAFDSDGVSLVTAGERYENFAPTMSFFKCRKENPDYIEDGASESNTDKSADGELSTDKERTDDAAAKRGCNGVPATANGWFMGLMAILGARRKLLNTKS